ncbi:MAG: tRNA (adenosine(37)-N6)-threonylcarbamoyltransferase complex ATPase subunit type 1 TsaE [Alphaproteobacteria bacterium]|nr:tRNA (adenosine(37)-N6)-threonylcarbamoyltransferase complex ATPase subunit type 1 TsaE [Alphaproteobacteria bacterium]
MPATPETRVTIDLMDEDATRRLAIAIAAMARLGDVIALSGELGAGKTSFARAFIAARAGQDVEVPSPTFTLVQTYDLDNAAIWHFDLYRIGEAGEARELGLDEAHAEGIALIEWPDRLGRQLPADRLDLVLAFGAAENARRACLIGHGGWARRLQQAQLQQAQF